MGMLIEGKWTTKWYTPDAKGRFQREATKFRRWVKRDGSTPHTPESGRYHLYVSYACPWAHRTLIMRELKGLQDAIDVSVVDPHMTDEGWHFGDFPGGTPDALHGASHLRDVYLAAKGDYTGRVTVPVLWDKKLGTIVNNESRELLRMLDVEFDDVAENPEVHLVPEGRLDEVEALISDIYEPVNNGVYKSGFASSQEAYDEAVGELFAKLDELDERLASRRFLVGDHLSEADVCLFTTLIRFDLVYHYHFKCNVRKIADFPHLSGYLRDVYQWPGVADTVFFDHIKLHYFWSHESINPTRIVPSGPKLDLSAPPERAHLAAGSAAE